MPLTILHLPPYGYTKGDGGPKRISPNDVIAFSMQKKKKFVLSLFNSQIVFVYTSIYLWYI